MSQKTIITCAVTGSIHTPSMSEYLPVTPSEIVTQSVDAAKEGAAVIHLHARDPETGEPTHLHSVYDQFLPRIKQACDAVINITTGGGNNMTIEQRLEGPIKAQPEICSLNMGSLNFPMHTLLRKFDNFKFDWERPYIESSKEFVFKSTFQDIEDTIQRLEPKGTRFEFECYDVGHLYSLKHFLDEGLVSPPLAIQFVMGILGGISADIENLVFLKQTADRLFGNSYVWSVLAGGRYQMRIATVGAVMGGNVRVGMEDSLYLEKGRFAKSNAEQVAKIRRILEELGCEIATPAEAREMLALKGGDNVAF